PQRLRPRGRQVRRLAVVGLGLAVQGSIRLSLLPQSAHPQVVHWLLPPLHPSHLSTTGQQELPNRIPPARSNLHICLQLHEQRNRTHRKLSSLHTGGPVPIAPSSSTVNDARPHQLLQGIAQIRAGRSSQEAVSWWWEKQRRRSMPIPVST
ncbi:hypothetical protein PMAYCL1PPCAC_19987, partial [Pristionchus mayeri]